MKTVRRIKYRSALLANGQFGMESREMALSLGQQVRLPIWRLDEAQVVRKITALGYDKHFGAGAWICADDGGSCRCCGRPFGTPAEYLDASHALPVQELPAGLTGKHLVEAIESKVLIGKF